MTVEEIFTAIVARMVKGIMVHDQLASYYDFLGLQGYKKCHEHHFYEENESYRKIYHYYVKRYNKLLPEARFDNPNIIPVSWLQYTRQQVDRNTKQKAVEEGLNHWVKWEGGTLNLYQKMYKELMDIGEVAAATYIMQHLIKDVSEELMTAEKYQLNKNAMGYDMTSIVEEQKPMHKKYK